MPINLREEIERADTERQQKLIQDEHRIDLARQNAAAQELLQKQNEEQLVAISRKSFDRYLMPILRDVSGAKKVPLTSPYEYKSPGLFGRQKTANRPITGGLEIVEVIRDYDHILRKRRKFGETSGKLIWNVVPRDDFDASEYSYSFLTLGVTSESVGYIVNNLGYPEEPFLLANQRGVDQLVKKVFEKMTRGTYGHYSLTHDRSSI